MILPPLLLALLTDADGRPAARARAQELRGRLGLAGVPSTRRSDLRARVDWALRTFPDAPARLPLLFSAEFNPATGNRGWEIYNVSNEWTDPEADRIYSRHRSPSETRFPPFDQGGPKTFRQPWPRAGYRDISLEQLVGWLSYNLTRAPLEEVWGDLRRGAEADGRESYMLAIAHQYVDEQDEEEVDEDGNLVRRESPWGLARDTIGATYESVWSTSREAKEYADPWLGDLRDAKDPDFLGDTWPGLRADDVPPPRIQLTWAERSYAYPSRETIHWLAPSMVVSDPADPTAWLRYDWIVSPPMSHFVFDHRHWRLSNAGTFEGVLQREDLSWRIREAINDVLVRIRQARDRGVAGPPLVDLEREGDGEDGASFGLPPLRALWPPDAVDLDAMSADERGVTMNHRHVPLSPADARALWQLRWLLDGAAAWMDRLEMMHRGWVVLIKLLVDEHQLTGDLPPQLREGWGRNERKRPMTYEEAWEWARNRHWDRADAAWEAEQEGRITRRGRPLPPLACDVVVASWSDGATIVELTNRQALRREGEAAGHCIGGHAEQVESGRRRAWSYRDDRNAPLATWEVDDLPPEYPGTDMQGPGNGPLAHDDRDVRPRIEAHLRRLRGGAAQLSAHERYLLRDDTERSRGDVLAADASGTWSLRVEVPGGRAR